MELSAAVGYTTSPDQRKNTINNINALSFYHEIRWNLKFSAARGWRANVHAPALGLWGTVKARVLSLAFVLDLGFLLLVSLVVSAVLSGMSAFMSHLVSSPWLIGRVPDMDMGGCKVLQILDVGMLKCRSVTPPSSQ
jgi:hypothetical protein